MTATASIPAELRERPQWVSWNLEPREAGGKPSKVPKNPSTGGNAKADAPETWGTYEAALEMTERRGWSGVGYEFSVDDQLVGIDVDGCRNPDTGEIAEWAQRIIGKLNSYTEVSPSGSGVKIFVRGRLPIDGTGRASEGLPYEPITDVKVPGIEMYHHGRYFAVTGEHVEGTPTTIEYRQAELEDLWREHFGDDRRVHGVIHADGERAVGVDHQAPEPNEILTAISCLQSLGAAFYYDYAKWLHVGMSLHSVNSGPEMLAAWDAWSMKSKKYEPGACAEKWSSFRANGNGEGLTIASLVKWAKENGAHIGNRESASAEKGTVSPVSDIANGQRMARRHGADLIYTEAHGWLVWDGRRFKADETGQVFRLAKQTAQAIASEAVKLDDKDKRDRLLKHAGSSQNRKRLEAMIWAARSEADIATMPDVFDQDRELFNVQNGTLDLRILQLKPHDRADRITKVGGVTYDPDAECPNFRAFMHEIFKADADLIAFYQRLFGYMLTGLTSEQGVYILWGGGANGKSVLLKVQAALMGDYAVHTQAETFMAQNNRAGGARSDLARLAGARLVTSTEVEDGQRLAENLVKQFSGEDTVTARKMYKSEFEFVPVGKIFIAANHKPVVRGTDYAIWRRINLIPFSYTVPKEKRIPSLADKRLIPELSGVLNWALVGLQAWRDVGLNPPKCVLAATEQYKSESDVLADWIADCCTIGPKLEETNRELRKSYKDWAELNGITKPLSDVWFGRRLADRGFAKIKCNGSRGWRGLQVGSTVFGGQE